MNEEDKLKILNIFLNIIAGVFIYFIFKDHWLFVDDSFVYFLIFAGVYVILIFISIFFHELGHYFFAKYEGIYAGWGLLPNPHIKLTKLWSNPIYHLSGFLGALVSYPLFFIFEIPFWFFIYMITLGCTNDIYQMIKQYKQGGNKNEI